MIFPLYTTTSLPSEGGFCTSRIQSHVGDIDRSRRREEEEEGDLDSCFQTLSATVLMDVMTDVVTTAGLGLMTCGAS